MKSQRRSPAPTRRVVDAMNVIGSRPDGWWRDRAAAIERLVARLDEWAAETGERVTVVLEQPPRRPLDAERVEVAWAPRPGPNSADREILRRLGDWLAHDEVVIVTSDRDLAERARGLGAEIEPAAGFRRRLGS
jgi:predicted RNA-binding protein with PIN domain